MDALKSVLSYNRDLPFSADSELEDLYTVVYEDCSRGLGIRISGGVNSQYARNFGIFVKRVNPGGLADAFGNLFEGDKLLRVNATSLADVTNEKAVDILKRAFRSGSLEILLSRSSSSKREFCSLLEESSRFRSLVDLSTSQYSSLSSKDSTKSDVSFHSIWNSTPLVMHSDGSSWQGDESFQVPFRHERPASMVLTSPHQFPRQQMLPPSEQSKSRHLQSQSLHDLQAVRKDGSRSYSHLGLDLEPASEDLSLPSGSRISMEKLEVALKHLGFDLRRGGQLLLRERLPVDRHGQVEYGAFVAIARELIGSDHLGRLPDVPTLSSPPDKSPPPATSSNNLPGQIRNLLEIQTKIDELKTTNRELGEELRETKDLLFHRERDLVKLEQKSRRAHEAHWAAESKLRSADADTRQTENDYKEIIKLLERENRELKERATAVSPNVLKRLAVLASQAEKSEKMVRAYHSANQLLVKLARDVVEQAVPKDSNGIESSLSAKARETLITVKKLLENDVLPFGWDEAYTEDAQKFYVNHIMQTTSWSHPVSQLPPQAAPVGPKLQSRSVHSDERMIDHE